MRKLIMWNLITLDDCFEGPQSWDLEFLEYAWGDELERFSLEQGREVGALLFGRATYEGMAAHWTAATGEIADFMNAVPKHLFSRTLESADWNNTTLVKDDAPEAVARLKEQPGRDLFVFGSADLSAALIRHGLFDEYRIGLVLVTLGVAQRGGRRMRTAGPASDNMTVHASAPIRSLQGFATGAFGTRREPLNVS